LLFRGRNLHQTANVDRKPTVLPDSSCAVDTFQLNQARNIEELLHKNIRHLIKISNTRDAWFFRQLTFYMLPAILVVDDECKIAGSLALK
jgi:hypothetical protein